MYAARHSKDPEIVKLLVEADSDINAKNDMEMSAVLFVAMSNPHPEVKKNPGAARSKTAQ